MESLEVGENIILVNGNLKVSGNIEDCIEVDLSFLFVLGNLESDNLFTFSQICITGNLTVKNTIVADSGGDYSLDVKMINLLQYNLRYFLILLSFH